MPIRNVGDIALRFSEQGAGSPLLLIHGTGSHGGLFNGVVPALAERHRVISYDRRGYSGSGSVPAPIDDYWARQASDAAALLEGLGAAPATLVGWSMGGVIALCLALDRPDLVTRVVAYEPPLHATKHMPMRQLPTFLKAMFLSAIGRKRAAAETFFRMSLARPDGSNAYDQLDSSTREQVLVNAATLMHELRTGTGEELSAERVRQLTCPITAIVGADTPAMFADAATRLQALLPHMQLARLPGAGHIGVMTHPDAFAQLVLNG